MGKYGRVVCGIMVCGAAAVILTPLSEAAGRLSREGVVEALADGYVTTEEKGESEVGSAVSQGDIKAFTSFRFKSAAPLAGSPPPTYGRFRLRLYEYRSVDAAAAALVNFADDVQASLFYKSPMLLFTDGPVLCRLDGECLFSREDWEEIERKLMAAFFPEGVPKSLRQFRMLCGGVVVDRPTEDSGR